jgi:DNA modification methylase
MTQNLQNHIIFKKINFVLSIKKKRLVCTLQNLPWANYSLVLKLGNPFGMQKNFQGACDVF